MDDRHEGDAKTTATTQVATLWISNFWHAEMKLQVGFVVRRLVRLARSLEEEEEEEEEVKTLVEHQPEICEPSGSTLHF